MTLRPLGPIVLVCIALSCRNPSDSKNVPVEGCSMPGGCEQEPEPAPVLKIWSSDAQAILLEKLSGPYSKADLVPGLYLEKKEMTPAQVAALEEWAVQPEADTLDCSLQDYEIAYKAVIFDEAGGRKVYYGAENACREAGPNAAYVPLSFFQNFPGDIPYRPEAAGEYTIEKVITDGDVMKVDVKFTEGCASYRNFTLMVDSKIQNGSPPFINGYIRHRTDNNCEALGRAQLEFDLRQYDFRNVGLLKLKGWTKKQPVPIQK